MVPELTTLCYIEQDGKYLMLHRTKKQNDFNQNLWLGLGGHIETGESPEECVVREVKEESGLELTDYKFRGMVTFSDSNVYEYMFLFTADKFSGEITDSDEGELQWTEKEKVLNELPVWEGDKIFLKLLAQDYPFFSLKLEYENRKLKKASLNGNIINISDFLS